MNKTAKTTKAPDIKTIENPDRPLNGTITLDVEKILKINSASVPSENPVFFAKCAKDYNNNLFLLDRKDFKIYKFDNKGKLLTHFLGKGEGPAELKNRVDRFQINHKNVWASYVTEFCRFDTNGNFLDKKSFKKQYGSLVHVDENRFIASYDSIGPNGKTGSVCALLNKNENVLKKLYTINNPNIGYSVLNVRNKNFKFLSALSPKLGYSYCPHNNLAYCFYNYQYEIHLIDLHGYTKKIIRKAHQKVPLTTEDASRIANRFKRMGWPADYVDAYKKNPPSKHLPAIRHFKILRAGAFAIVRSTSLTKNELDIFDADGRFLYIIKTSSSIPDVWDLYFFENSIGLIINQDESDVFIEFQVKNLPEFYGG
ncbi:MAG: hypothetical protein GY757_21590 [bacterium]|nr:hypothetical protein [bacterium]